MNMALFLLISGLLASCGGSTLKNISGEIPDQVMEWRSDDQDAIFDRDTLFDYMNGGAEVYLAFDFRQVLVRTFRREGGDEIVLDIYDMGSPAEAFGVFSCDREDETAGIGQDSEYGFGMLRFWQDHYFVTVMAMEDDEETEKAILELGRAVAGILGADGAEPEMLNLLPVEGLKRDRISYFHSNINLNNRFFIASENILNLDEETDCVFAEYESGGEETGKLLIVNYRDEGTAEDALGSFFQVYMPEALESGLARMEDGKWTLARIESSYVAIVFDALSEGTALKLQSAIQFE